MFYFSENWGRRPAPAARLPTAKGSLSPARPHKQRAGDAALHRDLTVIYRCFRQGVTANTRALEETKHAAPATPALSLIFAALPQQRERRLRKRSSDSPTKTRSGNATARAPTVPSSRDQAVECAVE